jgi:hypothetical protein
MRIVDPHRGESYLEKAWTARAGTLGFGRRTEMNGAVLTDLARR